MIARGLTVVVALMASPVAAQNLPARYATTGVAAQDRLNIRSAPDASSDIIGAYGPYALNIEVIRLSDDGKWGLIGIGERNGWVAMRFLAPSDHQAPNTFHAQCLAPGQSRSGPSTSPRTAMNTTPWATSGATSS